MRSKEDKQKEVMVLDGLTAVVQPAHFEDT